MSQLCDRWIYSACLYFALDLEEQRLSCFHYQYSNYQIEYSRNLIFEVGGQMEQVFQALIDRSRVRLDLKTVKTILGCKRRPKYRSRKKRAAEWEVAIETPAYDLTIFKLHCGSLTFKILIESAQPVAHDKHGTNTVALISSCPEGASFLQRSLRKSVDRYNGRSGDFVLVLGRCYAAALRPTARTRLERLDQPVQQNPIEATILPANAVLVVVIKGVHERPRRDDSQQDTALCVSRPGPHRDHRISRAQPLAS